MPNPRKLLYPFSLLYGGIMDLRNKLYDHRILESKAFDLPIIAVGNLSVGGSGKSPMIEYLVSLLKDEVRVAVLSRGYKRKTSGFHLLKGNESAAEVGDEPLQFKNKFPDVLVAVDEDRVHGINQLIVLEPQPEVILLDDAYQHRKVRAGLYILLTPYGDLYTKDLVLPAGNLREPKKGAQRADIVVVTKCPEELPREERDRIESLLELQPHQQLFFSTIRYSQKIFGRNSAIELEELQERRFTLVTGIANPKSLVDYLKSHGLSFEHKAYPDHHNFSPPELQEIKSKELILTTEKDYMRLKNNISEDHLFYLPITTTLLENEENFQMLIKKFVKKK